MFEAQTNTGTQGIEASNVATLRRAYELWNTAKADGESLEHWMALMADQVHWRSLAAGAPGMEFTRQAVSKEDVRGYFETLVNDWELEQYDVDEFIAQGDRVVMIGRCAWTHRGTGKRVDTPKCDVLRMQNGKIVDFMEYYDTAMALAATT